MRILISITLAILIAPALSESVSAAPVEYSAGHADIGLAYHDGELELHYHFGTGAIVDGVAVTNPLGEEYEADEAYVRVNDLNLFVLGSPLSQLDAAPGDSIWALPQNNVSGRPFLGIASEELDPGEVSSSTISLTEFTGPGNFALWQSDPFGGSTTYWQTSDGIAPGGETLNTGVGDHDHYFYGFMRAGIYDLGLTGVANLVGGGSESSTATFRFVVGSVAVPEPNLAIVLAVGAIPALITRRRRGRR